MLIQLPTGDWLDPAEVVIVESFYGTFKVVVRLRPLTKMDLIYCYESDAEAEMSRDEIARAVNLSLPDGPGGGR